MKVLFFGATGAVGQRVVPALSGEFELVLAAREAVEREEMPVHGVDICDFEATLQLMRESGADAVVNCAIADYRPFRSQETETRHIYHQSALEVNVRGAYHLYEAAARANIAKFVFISSLTTLLGLPRYNCIEGTEMPRPHNVYACTKLFGEQVGQVYAAQSEMSVTCLRLGQPYPLNRPLEDELLCQARVRELMVHMDDIALAITGALRNVEAFAVYPIVSQCEAPWVNENAARGLGYKPRYFFTSTGAVRIEEAEAQNS